MDYQSVRTATRAGRAPAARKPSHQPSKNDNAAGLLHFDSDRSTTLDSLKDLMAFSQRPSRSRQDDILFAAKHARAQMPSHFREPPSSTGSHGTITASSIHLDNDLTSDSTPSSTFSAGPDAESTRASVYQRGNHRVHRSTGRFGGKNGGARTGDDKKTTTDMLSGIVNTSALFRTFKEWKPEDETDTGIFEDADAGVGADTHGTDADAESTTNFGVLDKMGRYDQENCGPIPSSPLAAAIQHKQKRDPLADAPARRNRAVLQATVQNESDLSIVMTAAAQKPRTHKVVSQASPLRKASVATAAAPGPAPILKKSATTGSMRNTASNKRQHVAVVESPILEDLTSPETSAGSHGDVDIRDVAAPAPKSTNSAPIAPASKMTAVTRTDNNDGATNQSFIVPSKSFPLLHNLVTGTLRFTPGTYFYGSTADAQRKYQLPAGQIPEDEKEIFVDIENVREEVIRLQEHDEMLQNEIIQGEIKYKSLLDRFYGLAHKTSDHGFASDLDHPLKESQEQNQLLQNRIVELETALDVVHTRYEEQAQAATDAAAERDAAVTRADTATEKSKRQATNLEAARERLATSSQRPNQEAQRRIQQLEQMVAERERVIKALKDEREAATSSHREECKLYRERIIRMEAEKKMMSGDHAKCHDEKYALTTAKDALAQKISTLKERLHAEREQGRERTVGAREIFERQHAQITKLKMLLREKEKSVHQLDENFRKLRESWSAKDETLMRMTDVIEQWPGGLPQEHRGTLNAAETTQDFDVDTRDFQSEAGDDHANDYEQQQQQHDADLSESDGASDSGQSAVDHSMDENMTSAFIIPDLDFQAENGGDGQGGDNDDEDALAEQDLAEELAQVHSVATRNAAAAAAEKNKASSKSTKPAQQKTVSFQTANTNTNTHHVSNQANHTTKSSTSTSVCKHSRVNCVVCCQKSGQIGENEKVTVAVPRPISALLPDPTMKPGNALAFVMKLLDDERRHLWMQIQTVRKNGETEEALNDRRRPRRVVREAEELWNAYVLKVEQLNRLDDVLEGQRAAGQDMSREEIDVTITRILEA